MSRLGMLASVLLATGLPPRAHAQADRPLSAEDSARIIVATLQVFTDSLTRPTDSEPIWIWVRHIPREPSGERRMVTLSAALWAEINEAFPTAQPIPTGDSPFLCRPDTQMSLPGPGCPIRGGGTVVDLGIMRVEADSVTTFGMIVRSGTPGSPAGYAEGIGMVLERVGEIWRLRRTTSRAVT